MERVFDGVYQPVNMWRRGMNKARWLHESEAWKAGEDSGPPRTVSAPGAYTEGFVARLKRYLAGCSLSALGKSASGFVAEPKYEDDLARFRWSVSISKWGCFFKIIIPTLVLISLPPAAGAVVAYHTPPSGWGCRSLSFVTYSGGQVLLTVAYFVFVHYRNRDEEKARRALKRQDTETPAMDTLPVSAGDEPGMIELVVQLRPEQDNAGGRLDQGMETQPDPAALWLLWQRANGGSSGSSSPNRPNGQGHSQSRLDAPDSEQEDDTSSSHGQSAPPPNHRSEEEKAQPPNQSGRRRTTTSLATILSGAAFYVLFALSLFLSIGTTMMQIMGVYRNCLCYVTTWWWWGRMDEAAVDVGSDTWNQRASSHGWIIMGQVGTYFMVACAYGGWWFMRFIRRRFVSVLEAEVYPGPPRR